MRLKEAELEGLVENYLGYSGVEINLGYGNNNPSVLMLKTER
jgi:hypothetical protein